MACFYSDPLAWNPTGVDRAEIGGNDPVNNFRSTVSKDKRFQPYKRNNMHFWWLTGEQLPSSWIEAAGPDLLAEPAASTVRSSQEGGGGHEADNTILAS